MVFIKEICLEGVFFLNKIKNTKFVKGIDNNGSWYRRDIAMNIGQNSIYNIV